MYNGVEDQPEFELLEISDTLEKKINGAALEDVQKVTVAKVKEATEKLKPGKSDPLCNVNSDCIKNATDVLFDHLATVIKCFLIHGHGSLILLLAPLIPIVKDKLLE